MLLPLEKLGFSHSHNRRCHHTSEADLASLQAFRSHVSDNLNQVFESLKLGPDSLSLTWIHECFRMLRVFNNEFAKLMVEIDYPVSSWEACSVEKYLEYSIKLLDLLNSISSSVSHLNEARVSLSHALSLMGSSPSLAIERMREIKPRDSIKEFNTSRGDGEGISNGRKGRIFNEAMLILEDTGYWVCGVVLLGLKSDVKPIREIMRSREVSDSVKMAMESVTGKKKIREEGGFVEEVEGVNETVRLIVSSGNGDSDAELMKELRRRLEVLGNGLKGLKEEEEGLFGKVMAARNEVLETLRRNTYN